MKFVVKNSRSCGFKNDDTEAIEAEIGSIIAVKQYLHAAGLRNGILFAACRAAILADIASERDLSDREARYVTLYRLAVSSAYHAMTRFEQSQRFA